MKTIHSVSSVFKGVIVAVAILWPAVTAAAERGQGVTSAQLPEELRALTLQKQFVRGQGVPIGKVGKIRGHLIVRHGNSPDAYFAAQGDTLYAHDELFTLKKSRVRVRFTTADIVNMGANTRIRVDELVDDRQRRRKKTRMSMLRGKAMFYVMRLMKYNQADTAVTTPTAVCGVRGTKFGVIVRKKSDLWSGLPLYLADASGAPLPGLLADNGGGDTETVMIMVEGSGFMTAGGTTTPLGSGQSGTAGPTGPPATGPTPPGQDQGLNSDTNPDGGGGDTGDDDDGGGGDTGDEPNAAGELGESGTDTTNSVNQQTLTSAGPENHIGYFAAMLTGDTGEGVFLDNLFVSSQLQDHEQPGIIGVGLLGEGGETLTLDGTSGAEPVVASADTNASGQVTGGAAHQIQATQVGINQFLEWGYWTMTTPMIADDGTAYVIDNRGVYVHGDPTPLENLGGITGHYAGTAWGTLWQAAGGVDLTGTMQADVNLGSTMLNNFKVYTEGSDGSTVTIQQFSPVYFNGPNGEFQMGSRDASFQINGTSATAAYAIGGLFGNGDAIGGTAAMEAYDSRDDKRAVLGFEGLRNGPPSPPESPPAQEVLP